MHNIKHIIWDWNGTLLNDTWLFVDVMNSVLSKRNMPLITEEIYRDIFTFPVKDYYIKLGYDLEKESFETAGMEFIDAYHERQCDAELFDDALPFLNDCLDKGITHSIVSAQNQDTLDRLVNHYQIADKFTHICGLLNHYADGKTHVGHKVMDVLPFEKDEILFIGDTTHDAEVAHAIGVKCILVSRGHNSQKRLHKTGCEVHSRFKFIM
jgi:phosphoglycolate phosphatase